MPLAQHDQWIEQMQQISIDAAKKAVAEQRRTLLQDQLNKTRLLVREYSSQQSPSGTIILLPRTNNTVRIHTILAVFGSASTATIQLGDDTMIFPTQATGYIFLEGLDILLGRGDKRSLVLGTPGAAMFFGVWGEQVGDAQAIA